MELKVSQTDPPGMLSQWAMHLGDRMQSFIDGISFKNSSTNGIIKALLTGERSGLTTEVTKAFRDSGASHILALSGLHLGIIYAIICKMLSITGNGKKMREVRSALIIVTCGLYTLATGAGASITRAYIFIVIKEIAEMTCRHASLKILLAAAAMLHLAFDPTAAADIGFQLSYAAIFGIAYIFPHLRNIWTNEWKGLRWIWESAALSISCQLTTGPLAYCYFGTFPQYFLLTNLIAIPLAGIIIPAALLTTVLSAAGCCPDIVITITEWLTQTMYEALRIIASM
jgi:competence protein ComEC